MEQVIDPPYDESREFEIIRLAQTDADAFQPLYLHWVTPVFKYLLFRTGNPSEAEDLTAQTFLQAYQALPRYKPTARFAAWLFTIARNLVRDHYRKAGREVDLEAAGQIVTADFREASERRDEIELLRQLIKTLPEEERELIRLRYVAQLSFAVIGTLLGRREDAVKKSLYRLQARLQTMLEVQND